MNVKIIVFILLIASITSSGCIETGKGTSKDTLYGSEYNGLIWKTYSVYLTNDHPTKDYSAIYTISVNRQDLIEKLKQAEESNQKVKVFYHNEAIIWPPWEFTTNAVAIIDDIQPIKE